MLNAIPQDADLVLAVWPVLGYWDFLASRILGGPRIRVVVHDPEPLVNAIGYGRLPRRVASLRWVGTHAIVHSALAEAVVKRQCIPAELSLLPHPMLPPTVRASASAKPQARTVRVVGRYKPDRDLDALAAVARSLPTDWTLEIAGRGWPTVDGWTVDDRFIPEEELDTLLRECDVVLVPYSRFFQSGIAVRALEQGTPVVGPRASSLSELVGEDSPWLVTESRWAQAIQSACDATPGDIDRTAARAYDRVVDAWGSWRDLAVTPKGLRR
jgi:glycosyltransferase involved in cell wall biosynthesis